MLLDFSSRIFSVSAKSLVQHIILTKIIKSASSLCYDQNTLTITFDNPTEAKMPRNYTIDGIECQRWDVNTPSVVNTEFFQTGKLQFGKNNNFCQNPDNDPDGPWCYIKTYGQGIDFDNATDPNCQTCGIPNCENQITAFSDGDDTVAPDQVISDQKCHNKEKKGTAEDDYYGTVAITKSGYNCQKWTKDWPNKKSDSVKKQIPSNVNHNYCRKYDSEQTPWCYTTNKDVEWEYCEVAECDDAKSQASDTITDNSDELECGLSCECGDICDPSNSCNIVQGKQAHMTQFPWQAHIRSKYPVPKEHKIKYGIMHQGFCGGSVLNKKFIITAAHCFDSSKKSNPNTIVVAVGFSRVTDDIDPNSARYGQQILPVKRIIRHENYSNKPVPSQGKVIYQNDIALVELKKSIKYPITKETIADGSNLLYTLVRPICLPGIPEEDIKKGFKHTDNDFETSLVKDKFGDRVFISGFGRMGGLNNGPISDTKESTKLLYANVHRFETKKCAIKFPLVVKQRKDDLSQVCITDKDPKKASDTCNGDSGGPMTAQSTKYFTKTMTNKQKHALIGLTSYGSSTCSAGASVFTRLSNYIDWIQKYTKDIQIVGQVNKKKLRRRK